MNRQQRRAYYKSLPAYKKMSVDARAAALVKNGITVEDLKAAKNEGYQLGVESAIGTAYAAFCLAMKEICGFDRDKMIEILRCADDKVVTTLDKWEIIDEVYQKYGFHIDFREGIERVQEDHE